MYHHVNFAKRLCLLSLENQSDYHWFVLLHNCLNYNKLPSLFLESSCVYGLRSTDSNIYSVPKIMRTCSAGGFPYAALFLWENPPSQLEKQFRSRRASVRGHRVLFRPFWASSVGAEAIPGFLEKSEFVVLLGALGNGAQMWALSPWSQVEAWGNCIKFHPRPLQLSMSFWGVLPASRVAVIWGMAAPRKSVGLFRADLGPFD